MEATNVIVMRSIFLQFSPFLLIAGIICIVGDIIRESIYQMVNVSLFGEYYKKLPNELNCPKCGKLLDITLKDKIHGQKTCENCRNLVKITEANIEYFE
jgi:hypothetical protein